MRTQGKIGDVNATPLPAIGVEIPSNRRGEECAFQVLDNPVNQQALSVA